MIMTGRLVSLVWVAGWIRPDRRQLVRLRFHLGLDLRNRAVELLVFPFEFLRRIVIDHDVGINAVTFNDPILAILRIRGELGAEELAAVGQGKRVANAYYTAPGPFPNQLAQAHRLEPEREDVAIGCREFVTQSDHWADERLSRVGLRRAVARDLDHDERPPEPFDDER